ncbi:MAG TPA: hypothetical protein VH370_10135 [Humisphaera sp.]|nr:hypothetical protein [Humisphaera sp.]
MTQQNPANDPQSPPQPPTGGEPPHADVPAPNPPPKRRWLRRTLYIVAGLVIVLLLLALLIPTIASTGWVRSIVVGKVNDQLNGKLQIADWSIGWTGGIKADGIKIFDDQNRQILEIPHVSTQLSLLNAIRGKYAIGDTVIQGLDFYLLRDGDSINFQKLAKSPTSSTSKSSKSESEKSSSGKLPEVSGQIRLVNCRGTIENITKDPKTGKQQHDMVKLTAIDGEVKIPDINSPITNNLKIVEENGASVPGSISLNGQVIAVKNNEMLKPEQMDVAQTLTLENIDLKGFAFAVPDTVLAGNTNGSINATLKPGEGASLSGSIQLKAFRYGGPALSGDTYSADTLTLAIPQKTGATLKTVGDTVQLQHLSTGGAAEPITITVINSVNGAPSTSTIKLLADASPAALQNLADNKAPGAPGTVRADLDLDVVPLAQMLPHVLHTLEGVKLDKGRIANTLEVRLSAAQADISQTLSISAITGEDSTHKKIAIDPINLALKANDRGGLAGKIPDLHDITLNLSTGSDPKTAWASANVTAATLSSLKGAIHADIQRAQAQLGQLIDTGALKLGGVMDVALDSQGDLLADAKPGQTSKAAISVNTTIRDLVVDGLPGKPPVKEPYVGLNLAANLERGSDGLVKALHEVKGKILTGSEANPSVNATLTGDYNMTPATGAATAPSANESLQYVVYIFPAQIQNEFGAFLSSLSDKHLQFTNGIIDLNGSVTYDGKKAILNPTLNLKDITLVKDKTHPVLNNYALNAKLPATYESNGGGSTITISSLFIGDNVGMVTMESVKDQPIRIVSTADGRLQPTAALHIIRIDLKQINDRLNNFSAEAVATSEQGSTLRSGLVSGMANVSAAENHQIQVTSDLAIDSITISAPQATGLQNEQMKVALNLRAADDFSAATVNSADVTGSFLTAHMSDTQLMLKQGTGKDAQSVSTMDMLRKATVKVDVPSLAKLQVVMDAFNPPTPTAATPAPAPAQPARAPARNARAVPQQPAPATDAPKPPTKLTGGSATLTLNATRNGDRLSIVPTMAMRAVTAKQGDQELPVKDVDVSASSIDLVLRPAPATSPTMVASATTQPSIMDQIQELKIGQLSARVTGAEVVVNGSIVDLSNTRGFQNFAVDLNYDAPKLWPYLVPLIFDKESQAKWQNAKVAGAYKKHFPVTGSYPTTLPAGKQPIALLATNGDITLDHFEGQGATIDKLFLPITLKDGILSITDASKPAGQNLPAPATVNGGKLDLGGAFADLTTEHWKLNIPAGKKLLDNIDLNPALAQNVGDWVNNPLYITANQAAGKMTITVNKCENLPLDDTVKQPVASNTGIWDSNITVSQVQIGNPMLEKVSGAIAAISPQTLHVASLQGQIKQWHVVIDHGVTHTDMVVEVGESKRPVHLFGDVTMLTRNMNMTLDLPWDLFGLQNNKTFAAMAGGGIAIPLSGPINNPQFDAGKAVQQNLIQNGGQNLLQGILGQKKDDKSKNGQPPTSQPAKEDPLKSLQDLLNQNKKKDKDK